MTSWREDYVILKKQYNFLESGLMVTKTGQNSHKLYQLRLE